MIDKKPAAPVMRYHGGKWKLGAWILSFFPPHQVYVEPFGGAASVLMQKPRVGHEVYNDLDRKVVNVFRVLRDPVMAARLKELVELTPYSRDEFKLSREGSVDPVEQARRTVVAAAMSFSTSGATRLRRNGFRRALDSGGGKAGPANAWANYPGYIEAFTDRLRGVLIENREAVKLLEETDGPDVLFYVDPPYVASARSGRREYHHEMSDGDHERLAEALHKVRGMVVLSGYHSELYDRLYGAWEREEMKTNAQGQAGAVARREVLWFNEAAVKGRKGGQERLALGLAEG